MTLSDDQKLMILYAKNKVCHLQEQCDKIYKNLIKDLNFEIYQKEYDNFNFTTLGKPASILFDIIFNDDENDQVKLNILQKALDDISCYE